SVTPPPFVGHDDSTENMKLLMVESDTAFVGGRNRLYYLSLKNLSKISVSEKKTVLMPFICLDN
ncbi:hypothetical protein Bpfe_022836, partial [Biomphalaria pfeifferi]